MTLVDPAWLQAHLGDRRLVVVDMRWRGDGSGRALYEAGHVPGSVYLDWSVDLVDPNGTVAFMLAPPRRFSAAMASAGIGDDSVVVAYADRHGSGPYRLWWSCRVYGHDQVRILDGGWEAWVGERRPVTDAPPTRPPAGVSWTARPALEWPAGFDEVLHAATEGGRRVADSRPGRQYRGAAVWFETGPIPADGDGVARTPRGELRAGRVPGAVNVPTATLYRRDRRMRDPGDLRRLFAEAGLADPGEPVVTYCGVGISAAALAYALRRAGFADVLLYDGSWEEWGRRPDAPVERG